MAKYLHVAIKTAVTVKTFFCDMRRFSTISTPIFLQIAHNIILESNQVVRGQISRYLIHFENNILQQRTIVANLIQMDNSFR